MKIQIAGFLLLSGLILTSTLSADPNQVYKKTGPYITADGGYGRLFTPDSIQATGTNSSFDQKGFVWSAGVGYNWGLDTYSTLGLEVDYLDNGEGNYTNSNGSSLEMSSHAYALLGAFDTMWTNGINFFAKMGPAYVVQNNDYTGTASVNGYSGSGDTHVDSTEILGIIGLGYFITPQVNLFVDLTALNGEHQGDWSFVTQSGKLTQSGTAASAQIKAGLSCQF